MNNYLRNLPLEDQLGWLEALDVFREECKTIIDVWHSRRKTLRDIHNHKGNYEGCTSNFKYIKQQLTLRYGELSNINARIRALKVSVESMRGET